jgi:hypothetical protein
MSRTRIRLSHGQEPAARVIYKDLLIERSHADSNLKFNAMLLSGGAIPDVERLTAF